MSIPATRPDAYAIRKWDSPTPPPTLFIFLFFRLSDFSRDETNESDLLGEGWGRNVLSLVYLQGALGRKCESRLV